VPTTTSTTSTAGELLGALRLVVKGLEHSPLPVKTPADGESSPPAPRHVAALMLVVADEGLSVTTLAAQLGVSLATASQVVTDLEARGLVERFADATDRRRTLVRVAESHRTLADALLDQRLRPVQRALDQLKPADQRALIRGLELIAAELGNPEHV
jgi:DNA-binding MarR family transcriptional regulator